MLGRKKKHEHDWLKVWTDGIRYIYQCWCGEMGYGRAA